MEVFGTLAGKNKMKSRQIIKRNSELAMAQKYGVPDKYFLLPENTVIDYGDLVKRKGSFKWVMAKMKVGEKTGFAKMGNFWLGCRLKN